LAPALREFREGSMRIETLKSDSPIQVTSSGHDEAVMCLEGHKQSTIDCQSPSIRAAGIKNLRKAVLKAMVRTE
jgi:hypothetical protein